LAQGGCVYQEIRCCTSSNIGEHTQTGYIVLITSYPVGVRTFVCVP